MTPIAQPVRVLTVCEEIYQSMSWLIRKYLPWISTIPIKQEMRWIPTWKSLPTSVKDRRGKTIKSCLTSLVSEMAAFARSTNSELDMKGLVPSILLWQPYIRYAGDPLNMVEITEMVNKTLRDHFVFLDDLMSRFPKFPLGRLAATPIRLKKGGVVKGGCLL